MVFGQSPRFPIHSRVLGKNLIGSSREYPLEEVISRLNFKKTKKGGFIQQD
jgi:hypothetical protein